MTTIEQSLTYMGLSLVAIIVAALAIFIMTVVLAIIPKLMRNASEIRWGIIGYYHSKKNKKGCYHQIRLFLENCSAKELRKLGVLDEILSSHAKDLDLDCSGYLATVIRAMLYNDRKMIVSERDIVDRAKYIISERNKARELDTEKALDRFEEMWDEDPWAIEEASDQEDSGDIINWVKFYTVDEKEGRRVKLLELHKYLVKVANYKGTKKELQAFLEERNIVVRVASRVIYVYGIEAPMAQRIIDCQKQFYVKEKI